MVINSRPLSWARLHAAILALLFTSVIQLPAQTPPRRPPPSDTLSDSSRALLRRAEREARAEARRRVSSDSIAIRARAEAAAPTAFADTNARIMLERARVARMGQDSALKAYRAKTTQRITGKLGAKRVGLEKLLFQGENVATVEWQRNVGVWITPHGSRMNVPMASDVSGDFFDAVSVPYFPGRESLWFPSSNMSVARADVNERDIIHPLARGAEAYYRYATGDSMSITLPNKTAVRVRELKITPRKPEWRRVVGSFWFDRESGQLVRAAYRLSVDIDIWETVTEETQLDAAISRTTAGIRDSILREQLSRDDYVKDSVRRAAGGASLTDDDAPAWVKAMFRPARARLDGVTVEYGLYEGRFWLPRHNGAEMSANVGFVRMPIEVYEKFDYDIVNGDMSLAELPPPRTATKGGSDTIRTESSVTVVARVGGSDSAATAERAFRRDSARAALHGQTCHRDSSYTRVQDRYNGTLRIAYKVPCDSRLLINSAELPPLGSSNSDIFNMDEAKELLSMLDLSLQPAWSPQAPQIRTGIDYMRYNRIEGMSVGAVASQQLGAGYTVSASGRVGHADKHLNGEFSVERSNGRRLVRATAYHRLSASNPEWAAALSWGASMPALLYSRDEGFYYRNFGVELSDQRERSGNFVHTRLFVERQWTAGDSSVVNTFSLGNAIADRRFLPNRIAEEVSLTGVGIEWMHSYDPYMGATFASSLRAEAATGTFEYGRGSLEISAIRPAGKFAISMTGSAGSSIGRMPAQRQWYIGGVRTVRGQIAGTQEGNAFWLVRGEIGTRSGFARPVAFFDIGWAGARDAIGMTQPQRGAGMGLSLIDGLFRVDFSRGLYPNKRWRTDLYLQAPL